MAENVTALPSVMQTRRAQLAELETPTTVVETPPVPPNSDGEKVTISREEFNDLQAAAGKARAAEGRAEALAMDVETLKTRLTDLETAAKGNGKPNADTPPAAQEWEPLDVGYTDQEQTDYGESKSFVVKAVNERLNEVVPKLLARISKLEAALGDVKVVAEGASKTATGVRAQTYNDRVREALNKEGVDFDECVNHKHWQDFAMSVDPDSGYQYMEMIRNNVQKENVQPMVKLFLKFKEQYGVGSKKAPSGYEGAAPTGTSAVTDGSGGPEMLPFSERKEAHRKYINHEISYEEYEKIRKKFENADKENRVDYNK